jgi:hypothetical protein
MLKNLPKPFESLTVTGVFLLTVKQVMIIKPPQLSRTLKAEEKKLHPDRVNWVILAHRLRTNPSWYGSERNWW